MRHEVIDAFQNTKSLASGSSHFVLGLAINEVCSQVLAPVRKGWSSAGVAGGLHEGELLER